MSEISFYPSQPQTRALLQSLHYSTATRLYFIVVVSFRGMKCEGTLYIINIINYHRRIDADVSLFPQDDRGGERKCVLPYF